MKPRRQSPHKVNIQRHNMDDPWKKSIADFAHHTDRTNHEA